MAEHLKNHHLTLDEQPVKKWKGLAQQVLLFIIDFKMSASKRIKKISSLRVSQSLKSLKQASSILI
jgi:hypothetical protein